MYVSGLQSNWDTLCDFFMQQALDEGPGCDNCFDPAVMWDSTLQSCGAVISGHTSCAPSFMQGQLQRSGPALLGVHCLIHT